MLTINNNENYIEINAQSITDKSLASLMGTYTPETMSIYVNFENPFYLEDSLNKEVLMKDISDFLDIVYNKLKNKKEE